MGASHSREGSLESDYSENEDEDEYEDKNQGRRSTGLEAQLQELSLGKADTDDNLVKLYKHIGGNTSKAKWVLCEKLVPYLFIREGDDDDDDEEEEEEEEEEYYRASNNSGSDGEFRSWFLRVGSKLQARVENALQMKFLEEQLRVDFVQAGVWAIKFPTPESYHDFATEFRNCLFENTYGMEASDENKTKIFGSDFMAWADPRNNDAADETVWMTPEPTPPPSPSPSPSARNPTTPSTPKLQQRFEEDAQGGIQSVAMGALDYSFVLSDTGVEAVRNFRHGIHGKGVSVALSPADSGAAPKKGILMKSERQMVVMSPSSPAVQQLDVDAGKIVAQWHMRRDGADLRMSDITHDTKAAQLDPGVSTFMGLGANSLCRWDMRSPAGIVQENRRRRGRSGNDGDGDGDGDGSSTVLSWANGHQFSRGTNFRCFATAGDGSLVVGSADGKIRLYGSSSLRQAKTAFPGLGSPITHVDVTYDAKWIVGTTDTYLIVISTVFTDKDGKLKTGFSGRMGHRIPVPRMLKLQPLDAYLAGDNKFHGGQFSWVTESGKEERHIVASVGKFTVIWNFNQVKNSNHECYKYQQGLKTCYCYRIVPKDESVVESKFMHEKFSFLDSPEAPLVVATPKKVSSFSIAS